MSKRIIRAAAVVLLVVSVPAWCQAESCEDAMKSSLDAQGRPHVQVYLIRARNCFGTEADSDPLVAKVTTALNNDKAAGSRVRTALGLLTEATTKADSPLAPSPQRQAAQAQLKRTTAAVAAEPSSPGKPNVSATDWEWNVASGVPALPGLRLDDDLQQQCAPPAPTTSCEAALRSTHAWLRLIALTHATLIEYSSEYTQAVKEFSDRRVKMWHAYRDEALPQFPWEYALNSYFMKRNDKRPVVDGNPQGYETIPTSQYIFLHPGASLEWRDAKQDTTDSNVKPALYLEVLGVNRWSFDDSTGEMLGGKGISLILSYANREGRTSTGYGLMFHSRLTKQFSLGITRAGNETVYLVNVDLAEYFKTNLSYWKDIGDKMAAEKQ